MKKIIFTLLISLSLNSLAECVHESMVYGMNLMQKSTQGKIYVETNSGVFIPLERIEINPYREYLIQRAHTQQKANFPRYNRKYIEYYRYSRVLEFLSESSALIKQKGYITSIVGESVEGRQLLSIRPKIFDKNKKTIIMLGRHHGDEGTANWIIEGFLKSFLIADTSFHKKYQLVLYPMVNPDGAENQSRYNKNGRDLNRSWSATLSKNYDEAKIIHTDLKKVLKNKKNTSIVLDMHGSFYEDFIYRVDYDFIDRDFYNHQQVFIDQLAMYDTWQNGRVNISNGDPRMARIVMIKNYGLNALTHETPRDIKIKNSEGRNKETLMVQGTALFQSIRDLY